MTPAAAVGVVQTLVKNTWTLGSTAISWPNVDFTPPASGLWLKVDWIFGAGFERSHGATKRHSVTAVLQLAIFAPKGSADGPLDSAAQTMRAAFNGLRMASPNQDVVFGAASGPVKRFEESWRSAVVSIPMQVYESV